MSIATLVSWFLLYKYAIILVLVMLQGPVVMTMSGVLLRLDYASFWPLYLTLMAGDLIGDIIWYLLGYHFAEPFVKKFGKYVGVSEEFLKKIETVFRNHSNKILFFSKVTMGLGFALVVLMTAGMTKVPFRKYLAFNAFGQIFWTILLLGLGYSFGNLYIHIDKSLKLVSIVAFFIVIIFALRGFGRYVRNRNLIEKL